MLVAADSPEIYVYTYTRIQNVTFHKTITVTAMRTSNVTQLLVLCSEYTVVLTSQINTLEDAKNAGNEGHDISQYGQLKNR